MSLIKLSNYEYYPIFPIAKACLLDKRLYFKDKGIFFFLTSKPDNWHFNYEDIVSNGLDGTDSVKRSIRELLNAGYLIHS